MLLLLLELLLLLLLLLQRLLPLFLQWFKQLQQQKQQQELQQQHQHLYQFHFNFIVISFCFFFSLILIFSIYFCTGRMVKETLNGRLLLRSPWPGTLTTMGTPLTCKHKSTKSKSNQKEIKMKRQ